MQIPMSSPDLRACDVAAVHAVLETPVLSIGPWAARFEAELAARVGVPHGCAVSNGTAGLHLAVIAAGVEADDLVLTTPFSFVSTANVVLYERAIPVFVDVDPDTGNLDPLLAAEAAADLSAGGARAARWLPRSARGGSRGTLKALLPVHTFGQPADMDPLCTTARAHNLRLIEDACEAVGAEYKGRPVGSLGDAAVFAFYPNKQMTAGEGGMIVTAHYEWDALFRSLRNQGRDVFDVWLSHSRLGYNYRLDEMSAALGTSQCARLDELLARRATVAGWYAERLAGVELVETPRIVPTTSRMSWFVYVVRIRPPAQRDALMARLAERGVPSRPYFTPIHLQSFYGERFGYRRGDFPVTEWLGDVSLALPFSGVMTEQQVDYVCAQVAASIEP